MIRIRLVTYLIFFFGGGAVKKDAEGGDNGFACRLSLQSWDVDRMLGQRRWAMVQH